MSEVSKGRLAIDFDEIERHLRAPAPAKDPLAELARIVGQDDPFRTLLAEPGPTQRPAAMPAAGAPDENRAPTFADHLDAETAHDGPDAFDEDDAPFAAEPRRSRKGLIAVGAVLGVAVMGVAGALAWRGTAGPTANGEPPIIQADRSPSKVLPPNPGGVEIPNQDRQILERGADRQTKVVSREEQPVDVRQAARIASAGGELPSGLSGPSNSAMGPHTAAAAIGIEPKKVRTVTVRPDGSVGAPEATRAASPAPTLASLAAGGPAITSSTNPPAARPRSDGPTATPGATAAAPRATPGAAESPTTTATPPLPARPQRVASAAPMTPVAAAEPTVQPAPSGTGSFSVQLTTSDSESGGRAAFKALQQKHGAELGSRAPLIRKHEAEGKSVFRVRVGPMSKDEATGLCTRLKAAGGACFVAGA